MQQVEQKTERDNEEKLWGEFRVNSCDFKSRLSTEKSLMRALWEKCMFRLNTAQKNPNMLEPQSTQKTVRPHSIKPQNTGLEVEESTITERPVSAVAFCL